MAERTFTFLLPPPAVGEATFVTDYGLRGGRLLLGGDVVLEAASNEELARGVERAFGPGGRRVAARADGEFEVRVWVDGLEATRVDRAEGGVQRSAWIHGGLALLASACGFAASWLYVIRARASGSAWDMKMALHMAGWHALLTVTLPAAAILGGRLGLGGVRAVALVFFLIHAGIAAANTGPGGDDAWIAALNAASGLAFLATVLAPSPARPGVAR